MEVVLYQEATGCDVSGFGCAGCLGGQERSSGGHSVGVLRTVAVQPENDDGEEELRRAQGDHEVHAHLGWCCRRDCVEFVATALQSFDCGV